MDARILSILLLFFDYSIGFYCFSAYTNRMYHRISSRYHDVKVFIPDFIDITPNRDGGVIKKVIQRGNGAKGYPLVKDTVQIGWKIYLSNGTLVHSSEILNEPFDFLIGAKPRQVIQAWEYAVKSMFEGEIAILHIQSNYGFGKLGVPPIIPENATLTCELELIQIIPSVRRQYKSVGYNESIKDDFMDSIQSGQSSITGNVIDNKPIGERKDDKDRKYFDPMKHKLDPKQRVSGESEYWIWDENPSSIEIQVKLPMIITSKDQLDIDLRSTSCKIVIKDTQQVIIDGRWEGKITTSESSWAYLDNEFSTWYRGPRLLLSLQKAYGHQDIWANVIQQPNRENTTETMVDHINSKSS